MRYLTCLALLISCTIIVNAQLIIDEGKFLSIAEEFNLTDQMNQMKKMTTIEILIYTTMSLDGMSPKEYAAELTKKYPAGQVGINNGVVILISKNDRKLQLLSGFGLEWMLTDKEDQGIINEMIPYFKNREYYTGIKRFLTIINEKVSKFDWTIHPMTLDEIIEEDVGKIIRFNYTNESEETKFIYPIDSDPQFSNDFFILLGSEKYDLKLYYSKYMSKMIATILTKSNVRVNARLVDWDKKKLHLLGIEE